jgi:hypothetical protein
MELHNQTTERTNWTAFVLGCIAGAVPWVVVAIYLFGAESETGGMCPTSCTDLRVAFLFFNSFAFNMLLQYRRVRPWRDYLFGRRCTSC